MRDLFFPATAMEATIMNTSKSGYPLQLNGWELNDNEAMGYYKKTGDGYAFIDITWLDTTRDDPNYGTGREYCVCTSVEEESDFEKAVELFIEHHTDSYCISDVVDRTEAERIVLEYIEKN